VHIPRGARAKAESDGCRFFTTHFLWTRISTKRHQVYWTRESERVTAATVRQLCALKAAMYVCKSLCSSSSSSNAIETPLLTHRIVRCDVLSKGFNIIEVPALIILIIPVLLLILLRYHFSRAREPSGCNYSHAPACMSLLLLEIFATRQPQHFQIPVLQRRQLPASRSAVNYLA
jgi:hypothetical protein